ncbi:MAG: CrcB family protein, partial [Gammaproteobacteria bacterium]|nr:CrcB family protein [Gammaproteobacteria bacterium]
MIFVGGGLGAGSRFFFSNILNNLSIFGFAASTLLINIAGCLLIGFLMSENIPYSKSLQLFFGVGFLGSFTTFSTFTKEAIIFYEQIG